MNLLEYEAKAILAHFDIPVPKGTLLRADQPTPSVPVVLKSQVHTGGRGKAGGIRIITEPDEIAPAIDALLGLAIKDELPGTLLAEEVLDIDREYYLSLIINREESSIQLLAHRSGGIEVEENDPTSFYRLTLSAETKPTAGERLAEFYDLPSQAFTLQDIADQLYACFVSSDATLLEINPLVLTKQGKLVAADCKLELDDTAAWRHPDWNFETTIADANFIPLDTEGTIATVANGAGLAMATVDAVKAAGHSPANFLDIGGAATTESIIASFTKILTNPHVTHIVINIFGGIVRCDLVAQAIIEAQRTFDNLPELVIRLSGTNAEEARELLAAESITLYDSLPSALEAIS